MEVEMKIRGLMMDPVTNMPIVILKDMNGNTVLPIWVGVYEANAIALEIEKVSTPRPMTHDLIKSLLLGLNTGSAQSGGQRTEGRHVLRRDLAGARRRADQRGFAAERRPGAGACAWIARSTWTRRVLKSSKLAAAVSDKVNNEELRRWLEGLNDEDLGRYKM